MTTNSMNQDIQAYHQKLEEQDKQICDELHEIINGNLPNATSKVWHAHPVWFLDGNPIVGYSKRKADVQLMFWSGQSFDEPGLHSTGSFKASELRFTNIDQINAADIKQYLKKAMHIQWDYKNIVKNRGLLNLKQK